MYISVGAVSSNAMSVRCFKDDPQYIPHHPPAIAIQTATSNSFIRSDGSLPKRTVGNKFIPQINKAFYINAQTGAGVNTNNPQTSLDSFGAVKLIHSRIGVCTSENAGEI
ncbi:MAG: hypothetical protein LBI53_07345 [Candidatus Peribacteria bacterium]|jgi:hypothetical protein|nr:hypothetical protein [Candidatus Peribacteria bacterium]